MYRRRLRAPTVDCVPMGGSRVWIVIQRIQVVVSERVFAVALRSRVTTRRLRAPKRELRRQELIFMRKALYCNGMVLISMGEF